VIFQMQSVPPHSESQPHLDPMEFQSPKHATRTGRFDLNQRGEVPIQVNSICINPRNEVETVLVIPLRQFACSLDRMVTEDGSGSS
jgi:hypothetical protein